MCTTSGIGLPTPTYTPLHAPYTLTLITITLVKMNFSYVLMFYSTFKMQPCVRHKGNNLKRHQSISKQYRTVA